MNPSPPTTMTRSNLPLVIGMSRSIVNSCKTHALIRPPLPGGSVHWSSCSSSPCSGCTSPFKRRPGRQQSRRSSMPKDTPSNTSFAPQPALSFMRHSGMVKRAYEAQHPPIDLARLSFYNPFDDHWRPYCDNRTCWTVRYSHTFLSSRYQCFLRPNNAHLWEITALSP